MPYRDPRDPRRLAAQRRYAAANKGRIVRRRDEVGRIKREAKDVPCADCGIKYPYYVMQFDHVRGVKLFNLGNTNSGIKKVIEEIAKCEVVCANCHMERTHVRSS